ncbi:tudor domain-containing protein 5 isoform X2 [Ochotona princeps]|uniref:tudor domain-containing protein 5 isoform X2 n=1 Tax=Ochotona princeps TaxID=9978 RepID=UPI002714734C|nr:tudor domain-containing protein 5 isoform X2 [Ochotona princeps]
MSEQERIQECLRKEIRSLLISTKDGLTPQQLEKEYLLMVGSHLPLRALGYRCVMELVLDMPDVVSVCPSGDGLVILKAIPDESTKGIASLVARQRSSHKVRSTVQRARASVCPAPDSRRRVPFRGRVPPILPAVVKSELKDLLAFSPVLLSDFEKAFVKRFGRTFQYMQYGFLSMFEVLNAASDVIAVEQTRMGSLLMLRKNVLEEKQRRWPPGKIFAQPFRVKQGSYSGSPVAKAQFPHTASSMELPRQVWSGEKTPRLNGADTSLRLTPTDRLNQIRFTEKRRDRERDLPSAGSLSKWPQRPELNRSEARNNFWVSHMGTGSSTAFPGHKQRAAWEVEQPGHKPAPIWDPSICQLENTFKSVLAQVGPGGTIDPELKQKIKFVVSKFPEGLFLCKLLREFEVTFKEQLSLKKLGFLNVIELVGALSDILHVEFREGEQDLLVFDADLRPPPPDGAVSSDRTSSLVQSDKNTEAKVCTSNSSGNFLSTAATKETAWDCPPKEQREPEEKVYKKPNMVVKPLQLQVEINKPQPDMAMANHDIPPDAVREKKLCRLPPLDTSTLVGVFVEYIISPSQFYIRIYSRDSSELLEDMMIEMRRCYSNQLVSDRYIMPEYFIQPGHICCVRISEDKWWYRVIIHRVLGTQEVEVFYPDFGNIGIVQKSSLRFLKCCYTKLPAQAIPCSLAWVRPVEEHWTSKAILQFHKLCGLKPLVGVVDEYIDGVLNIFLCDTSSNEDVYFHHVLRTEGHAVVCRENVPSKGFRDLNPLALYTKSSSNAKEILTELGYPSQRHYFNEDREISPQSKESELHTLQVINEERSIHHLKSELKEPLNDLEFGSLKSLEKICEDDPKRSLLKQKDLEEENEDEIPSGMPCLESVTIGDDIWDENWLPLEATMGKGGDAGFGMPTASPDGDECPPCEEIPQEQLSLKEPSDCSTLPKLEEFYVSLIQSQQLAEGSPFEPDSPQGQPKPIQLSPAALDSPPAALDSPEDHHGSVESSPGSLKNEVSGSHAITVFKDKDKVQGAMDQLSLILSPEHQISQKLYVPRSTATAALGAAARLATSRSLLLWYPSVNRMEV